MALQAKVKFLDASEEPWYRNEHIDLYDVFEPNYLRASLTHKPLNLGSLIFGQHKWKHLLQSPQSTVQRDDPLTEMFRESGKSINSQ
jgi:hypothetical protein